MFGFQNELFSSQPHHHTLGRKKTERWRKCIKVKLYEQKKSLFDIKFYMTLRDVDMKTHCQCYKSLFIEFLERILNFSQSSSTLFAVSFACQTRQTLSIHIDAKDRRHIACEQRAHANLILVTNFDSDGDDVALVMASQALIFISFATREYLRIRIFNRINNHFL